MKQNYESKNILHELAKKDNRYIKESSNSEIVNILYTQNRRQKDNGKSESEK